VQTRRRRLIRSGLLLAAAVIGIAFFVLWRTPSSDYLFVPGGLRAVGPLVTVPNDTNRSGQTGKGIYMVDVYVKRATLLQKLFPGSDATVVPGQALNPAGVSDQQQHAMDQLDMSQSQRAATVVALKALGYDVPVSENGALVDLVVPNSPADKARLKPGDVIVEVNGTHIASPDDLHNTLTSVTPGSSVRLVVHRPAGLKTVVVGTEPSTQDPKRAMIGVVVEPAETFKPPVDIKINAGGVVGPSAGLAFALDIFNELGKTDLVHGRKIVATGELDLNGGVHDIGGIKQKAISARQAHADLFLVPSDQAPEARKYAGSVEVEPVSSFDEALRDLGGQPAAA